MQIIVIETGVWTQVVTGSLVDTLVQSVEGCLLATGASPPPDPEGIITQPMEKIIFPAGVDVHAMPTGVPVGKVITADFGV